MDYLKNPIYVSKPFLPDLQDFLPYLEQIWESKILTNNGSFHKQLEKELAEYLGVPYISLFANGTLGLVTALQVLGISGEVITAPFSFVATSHSLLWNNIKPVFVDIEPEFCNLDPEKFWFCWRNYDNGLRNKFENERNAGSFGFISITKSLSKQ